MKIPCAAACPLCLSPRGQMMNIKFASTIGNYLICLKYAQHTIDYLIDNIKCVQLIWADGLFWICLYFVVRLSSSTLLNKALAGKAKAKDLFFKAKAKASYFQGQGQSLTYFQGQGLTSLAHFLQFLCPSFSCNSYTSDKWLELQFVRPLKSSTLYECCALYFMLYGGFLHAVGQSSWNLYVEQ